MRDSSGLPKDTQPVKWRGGSGGKTQGEPSAFRSKRTLSTFSEKEVHHRWTGGMDRHIPGGGYASSTAPLPHSGWVFFYRSVQRLHLREVARSSPQPRSFFACDLNFPHCSCSDSQRAKTRLDHLQAGSHFKGKAGP